MKDVVYFLGAGFSKSFGYPLTGEIMPEILSKLLKHDLFELGDTKTDEEWEQEEKLLQYLYLIYPGLKNFKKNDLNQTQDIANITEVLSFVDHCCLHNMPPHPKLNERNLRDFQALLKRAVDELLIAYHLTDYSKSEEKLLPLFFDPIKLEKKNGTVSIITTNYDLIIDEQFVSAAENNRIDYGINYRSVHTDEIEFQQSRPLFKYFKLHGSLNWVKCDYCGQYYINPYGSILHQAYTTKKKMDNTCVCNNSLTLKSVMVTPSFVRDIRDSNLLQIWKGAMEAIRKADKLIFIGYSLPSEDLAIKSIIMRGINGRQKKNKLEVDVVLKDEKPKSNYINLFGNAINYSSLGLEDYLSKSQKVRKAV